MAARRLVIVMIVLLVISTVVAIIAPQPAKRLADETSAPVTTPEREDPGWADHKTGNHLHSVVNTDRGEIPKRIVALVGDRLRLEVKGGPGRTVAIPDLGLLETQSRTAPAAFELYFDQVGGYEVIDVDSGERLALIVVEVGERRTEAGPAPATTEQPERPAASSQSGRA